MQTKLVYITPLLCNHSAKLVQPSQIEPIYDFQTTWLFVIVYAFRFMSGEGCPFILTDGCQEGFVK